MATNSIKLDQHVALPILEQAVCATLDGKMTPEYAHELGLTSGLSKERSRKTGYTIRCATLRNPLMPWIVQHKDKFYQVFKQDSDKAVLIAGILVGAYPVMYNLLTFVGKYLHTEDTVKSSFIKQRLSDIYGSNLNFNRTMNAAFRMLTECGLLRKVNPGVYAKNKLEGISDFTRKLYRQAYLIHNPYLSESDNLETNPYFELIN